MLLSGFWWKHCSWSRPRLPVDAMLQTSGKRWAIQSAPQISIQCLWHQTLQKTYWLQAATQRVMRPTITSPISTLIYSKREHVKYCGSMRARSLIRPSQSHGAKTSQQPIWWLTRSRLARKKVNTSSCLPTHMQESRPILLHQKYIILLIHRQTRWLKMAEVSSWWELQAKTNTCYSWESKVWQCFAWVRTMHTCIKTKSTRVLSFSMLPIA